MFTPKVPNDGRIETGVIELLQRLVTNPKLRTALIKKYQSDLHRSYEIIEEFKEAGLLDDAEG